jgi:hypothetical protein
VEVRGARRMRQALPAELLEVATLSMSAVNQLLGSEPNAAAGVGRVGFALAL